MKSSDEQSAATPAADFTRTWRYKVGLALIIVGNAGIVVDLFAPMVGAGAGTVGALVVGVEPIPFKYDRIWETWHSGPDCSDADIWRENDPVPPTPDAPPPITNA